MLCQGISNIASHAALAMTVKTAGVSVASYIPAAFAMSQHILPTAHGYSTYSLTSTSHKPRQTPGNAFLAPTPLPRATSLMFPRISSICLQSTSTSFRYQSTGSTRTSVFDQFDDKDVLNHAYEKEFLESIEPTHLEPKKFYQRVGFFAVQLARRFFDLISDYGENMTEAKWIQRFIFLETVAGVPGMCAGMLRHLKSLRSMEHDNGWITHLLDEAENERMHLLTFLTLKNPGWFFRSSVIVVQGVFFNAYFLAYLLAPRTCHAFVGYLEEEAVKTYTHALKDIDTGCLKHWQDQKAPEIAVHYWKLAPEATMKDLILAVRADEAGHSHVNHKLSNISQGAVNPFVKDSKLIM